MPRQTRALIDRSALRDNYRLAQEKARPAKAMAVIKADGYGHGLATCVEALNDLTSCFAVATMDEAVAIRSAGSARAVVLLEGFHEPVDIERCAAEGFEPVLHDAHQVAALEAHPPTQALRVWLKCNTGMNRLGVRAGDLPLLIERLGELPGVELVGLMTHFACADAPEDAMTADQVQAFAALGERFPSLLLSASNSAGHFHDPSTRFDWTRPGIMLYGGTPLLNCHGPELGLRPVMHFRSRIIAVRDLEPGESVGYGATWTATEKTRMGIVEAGYGDGYPRHAPNGTPVAIKGQRVPLIGRVSMDMLAIDLGSCPEAGVGTEVELWGATVSVDEVADRAGTIGYELLTGVLPRVPRQPVERL